MRESRPDHEVPVKPAPAKRIGRGVFLATVAGGLSSLVWGKAVWGRVSDAVSPVSATVAPFLPTGGWRIYTVSGSMPQFDPASWQLEVGGLVESPLSLSYDELRGLTAQIKSRPSTASPAGR